MLNPTQFRFWCGYITEKEIAYVISVVNQALDEGYRVISIFLDTIEGFDTVGHDFLLLKFEVYGIRGPGLNFLRAFLAERLSMFRLTQSVH